MKVVPIIFLLSLSLLLASCGIDQSAPGGSGLIESTEIIVSSEAAGKLEAVFFEEGDKIIAGDTIGIIDTTTVALNLDRARAVRRAAVTQTELAALNKEQAAYNFDLAQKEFDRMTALIKSGSVNQQQYDKAENTFNLASLAKRRAAAALDAARADLNKIDAEIALLDKRLRDCFPVAPMSGYMTDKFIDPGELAGVGTPFVKISRLDTVWVKVYLPPADLTGIKLNDRAEIDPEDGGDAVPGYITWISSEAEFTPKNVQTREARADLVYAVKITIPNPDERLKIGMPVSVTIP